MDIVVGSFFPLQLHTGITDETLDKLIAVLEKLLYSKNESTATNILVLTHHQHSLFGSPSRYRPIEQFLRFNGFQSHHLKDTLSPRRTFWASVFIGPTVTVTGVKKRCRDHLGIFELQDHGMRYTLRIRLPGYRDRTSPVHHVLDVTASYRPKLVTARSIYEDERTLNMNCRDTTKNVRGLYLSRSSL